MDGDEVGRRLLEVVEDAPAEPDRLDDGGEVVVEKHQGRGLARDVGAAASHRDADVGGLQGRRVVDAVARHDDDLAPGLEGLDEPQLLRRHDAREDRDPADACGERGVVERVELGPRHRIGVGQADLARHPCGRDRIVPRDHDDADPGRPGVLDRRARRRTQRIFEAHEPEELEREIVGARRQLRRLKAGLRDGEHAKAVAGELLDAAR